MGSGQTAAKPAGSSSTSATNQEICIVSVRLRHHVAIVPRGFPSLR